MKEQLDSVKLKKNVTKTKLVPCEFALIIFSMLPKNMILQRKTIYCIEKEYQLLQNHTSKTKSLLPSPTVAILS